MTTTTIDLTAVTLLEFEFFGSAIHPTVDDVAPSSEMVAFRLALLLLSVKSELGSLPESGRGDATITLRRHMSTAFSAGVRLIRRLPSLDRRHLEILYEASALARSSEDNDPIEILRVFDPLTRPFALAEHESYADQLRRTVEPPNYEKHRHLTPSDDDAASLQRYAAAKVSLSMRTH